MLLMGVEWMCRHAGLGALRRVHCGDAEWTFVVRMQR